MANRLVRFSDETRRSERQLIDIAQELRDARLAAGLRQADIARVLGVSSDWVWRTEHGAPTKASALGLSRYASAVGMRLSLKLFPGPVRLRDAPQVALIERFLVGLDRWRPAIEVPVGDPGDLRAVDVVLTSASGSIAIEALTRLRDLQGQVRRATVIQRDGGFDRLILLIADTRANRAALAEAAELVARAFPVGTRAAMAALRVGRLPPGNAFVLR